MSKNARNFAIGFGMAAYGAAVTFAAVTLYTKLREGSEKEKTQDDEEPQGNVKVEDSRPFQHVPVLTRRTITVTYQTTTGTSKQLASTMMENILVESFHCSSPEELLSKHNVRLQCIPIGDVDWWDELLNGEKIADDGDKNSCPWLIVILPTWSHGTPHENALSLTSGVDEICSDWRVDPKHLQHRLKYAIYGIGSSGYDDSTFCKPAKVIFKQFGKLGAQPGGRLGLGDVESGDIEKDFDVWGEAMFYKMGKMVMSELEEKKMRQEGGFKKSKKLKLKSKSQSKKKEQSVDDGGDGTSGGCACKEGGDTEDGGCCQTNNAAQDPGSEDEGCCGGGCQDEEADGDGQQVAKMDKKRDVIDSQDSDSDSSDGESAQESDDDDEDEEKKATEPGVVDMEEMGDIMMKQTKKTKKSGGKEMVTPKQAKSLKKEGYKLIGTHSAVKMCRWTKHQLRGRGGCYKHTHYGITSYQCMEATPSLACANKCVFCWRHHKNPVGREWRWKTDEVSVSRCVKLVSVIVS